MAITAKINPASANIKFGETQKLTAVVEGAPVDATIAYSWKVDNVVATADEGSNGLTLTVAGDAVKTKSVELTAVTSASGEDDDTQTATASVVIAKADQAALQATLTVTPEEGKVGEPIVAKITLTGTDPEQTISYKWDSGETTPEITVTPDAAGSKLFKCEVTSKRANYNDAKVSRSKTIQVVDDTPEPIEGEFHIWPLSHIDAAFMYGSWWALDEIQSLTKEGKDWKTETGMMYENEIKGFKKILADYDTVMVQESRNGRIIDRVKLESGLIY